MEAVKRYASSHPRLASLLPFVHPLPAPASAPTEPENPVAPFVINESAARAWDREERGLPPRRDLSPIYTIFMEEVPDVCTSNLAKLTLRY